MTQDTQNKMAAILAAAQQKAADKTVTNFSQPTPAKQPEPIQPAPEPIPEATQPTAPVKMTSFTIVWQEGSGKFDGSTFDTWHKADRAMTSIYKEHTGQGYLKVKINVKWENGSEMTDRADCSDSHGDFCPRRETIGNYLKGHCDQPYLSFEDDETELHPLPYAPEPVPATFRPQVSDIFPELSTMTSADLISTPSEATEQPKTGVKIVDYSLKAFAVIGETKPIKELLRSLGGRFNNFLTCGPGWIFSKTRLEAVKVHLSL